MAGDVFDKNTLPYPCVIKHRTSWPRTEQYCFVSGRSRIQTSAQRPDVPTSFRAVLQSIQADARAVPSLRPLWFSYFSSLTSFYYPRLYSTAINSYIQRAILRGVKERFGRELATIQGHTAGAALERQLPRNSSLVAFNPYPANVENMMSS